jgi:hypothetical protein
MLRNLRDMDELDHGAVMTSLADAVTYTATQLLKIEKPLFVLVLFNDPEVAQYIGNCERADAVTAMREMADRLERRDDVEREPFQPEGR